MSRKRLMKEMVITSDVYASILHHSLSTKEDEVVGFLIGNYSIASTSSQCIVNVSANFIIKRIEKYSLRINISPEQWMKGNSYVDTLKKSLGENLQIVGWYHSHACLRTPPTLTDLKIQSMLEWTKTAYFTGLSISVFQREFNLKNNLVEFTAFQANHNNRELLKIIVDVVIERSYLQTHTLKNFSDVSNAFANEEMQKYSTKKRDDQLAWLHNESSHMLSLVNIITKIARPLYEILHARLETIQVRIKELEKLKQKYA